VVPSTYTATNEPFNSTLEMPSMVKDTSLVPDWLQAIEAENKSRNKVFRKFFMSF
jgi:hypothetical protein